MAERTQLRIADRDAIAEDDPFAELTRIMGFDPRVPAGRQEQTAPQADAADDFAIDLEKELMGEFGASDEPEGNAPEGSAENQPEAAFPQAVSADLPPVADEDADPAARFDEDIAAALDSDFEFEEGPAAQTEPEFAEPEFIEPEFIEPEFGEQPPVAEADEPRTGEAGLELRSDDGAESDGDFAAFGEIDFDLTEAGAEDAAPEEAVPEYAAPEYVGTEEAAPAGRASVDDFEAEFDKAMADVDMDFAARPAEDDCSAAVAVEPEPELEAAPADSLEDELDALLNQMAASPAPAYEEPEPVETVSAAVEDEAPQGEHAAFGYSASSDFDADLVGEPPAVEAIAADDLDAAIAADDVDAAEAAGIEFDHSAFDAAMAAGSETADEEPAVAGGPEPAAEDPLDALKWLAAKPLADAVASGRAWSRGTPYIPPGQTPAEPAASAAYEVPASYEFAAAEEPEPEPAAAPADEEVPDIETVDIPERAMALADDLDIPDLPFENEAAEQPVYDDLEAEFTSLLNEMHAAERAGAGSQPAYGGNAYEPAEAAAPIAAAASEPVRAAVAGYGDEAYGEGFDEDDLPGSRPLDAAGEDEFAFDPDFDEELALPDPAEAEAGRQPRSRAMMVAALVGAVALIGGVGALALSFGGGGGADAPVLVRADDNPIKVKPENPGGTVIPNQDNKVYDIVANGAKPAAPVQEKLVTDAEEPVDVAAQVPAARIVDQAPAADEAVAAQPSGKSEDRIAPATVEAAGEDQADVALVTPRKVRTMIVKPDGSLVPREEPEVAQVAATEPTDPAPQLVGSQASAEQTGAVAPASAPEAAAAPRPQAAQPAGQAATPAVAPVVPQRPAEQPVDIVGEVKPDKVAAVDTAGAAASGAWSMQIASQPSVESAQSTYQDLARRYAGVLEGRSVNIVKAEVAGKGTFYRVRVAANSRNEAISLCESYKAAGGNCFVSK